MVIEFDKVIKLKTQLGFSKTTLNIISIFFSLTLSSSCSGDNIIIPTIPSSYITRLGFIRNDLFVFKLPEQAFIGNTTLINDEYTQNALEIRFLSGVTVIAYRTDSTDLQLEKNKIERSSFDEFDNYLYSDSNSVFYKYNSYKSRMKISGKTIKEEGKKEGFGFKVIYKIDSYFYVIKLAPGSENIISLESGLEYFSIAKNIHVSKATIHDFFMLHLQYKSIDPVDSLNLSSVKIGDVSELNKLDSVFFKNISPAPIDSTIKMFYNIHSDWRYFDIRIIGNVFVFSLLGYDNGNTYLYYNYYDIKGKRWLRKNPIVALSEGDSQNTYTIDSICWKKNELYIYRRLSPSSDLIEALDDSLNNAERIKAIQSLDTRTLYKYKIENDTILESEITWE